MEQLAKKLAEEMGLSEKKIQGTKNYLGINEEDLKNVKELKEMLGDQLSFVVDSFLEHLLRHEAIKKILPDREDPAIVKKNFQRYFSQLLSGKYDLNYVIERTEVGIKYDFISAVPEIYLGALSLSLEMLLELITKMTEEKEKILELTRSLIKVFSLDVIEALSVYSFSRERKFKRVQGKLKRLNRIYQVLSEINALIVRERNQQKLFDYACRILHETGKFDLVWIGIHNSQRKLIEPVSSAGKNSYLEGIVISSNLSLPEGRGPAGISFRENKFIIIDDIQGDKSFDPWLKKASRSGFRAVISFPLTLEGKPVGVIALYSSDQWTFFYQSEIDLLQEVANNISLALEHIGKREQAEKLLFYDQLTTLGNAKQFIATLKSRIEIAREESKGLSILVLDINNFGNINHALGYSKGDFILKEVAKRLLEVKRENGSLGRTGADEFAIICLHSSQNLITFIDELNRKLASPIDLKGNDISITFSIGCASYPEDDKKAAGLLNCARSALSEAKKKESEQIRFYSKEIYDKNYHLVNTKREMESALSKQEFVLYFQPKINLRSRKITGVEALIRWKHPKKGLIPPGQFIPVLEDTGLIIDVGKWVIQEMCQLLKGNELFDNDPNIKFSFNVSPTQFAQKNFSQTLIDIVKKNKADPKRLKIEITETSLMKDTDKALKKLQTINDYGFGISIDDFGTGYSSLSYLKRIPASTLKIDMSFVKGLPDKRDDVEIVKAIITLAHSLGKETVAEGVETKEQLVFLTGLGVDEVQGYYFSKPMSGDKYKEYIKNYKAEDYFWARA